MIHDIAVEPHWHEQEITGLDVTCTCGAVLHCECDPGAFLLLTEIQALAQGHAESYTEDS